MAIQSEGDRCMSKQHLCGSSRSLFIILGQLHKSCNWSLVCLVAHFHIYNTHPAITAWKQLFDLADWSLGSCQLRVSDHHNITNGKVVDFPVPLLAGLQSREVRARINCRQN